MSKFSYQLMVENILSLRIVVSRALNIWTVCLHYGDEFIEFFLENIFNSMINFSFEETFSLFIVNWIWKGEVGSFFIILQTAYHTSAFLFILETRWKWKLFASFISANALHRRKFFLLKKIDAVLVGRGGGRLEEKEAFLPLQMIETFFFRHKIHLDRCLSQLI